MILRNNRCQLYLLYTGYSISILSEIVPDHHTDNQFNRKTVFENPQLIIVLKTKTYNNMYNIHTW